VATSFDDKEALIREIAFPPAPRDMAYENPPRGTMHEKVTIEVVQRALFSQAVQKAPGVDRLNFRALRLLWGWDSPRIIALARQCFRLGVHPRAWKTAKGILLQKPRKADYSLVKAYRVISLLNCLGKVVEKIAAEAIAKHCEETQTLHQGQMGCRKHRSAIDAVACLIQEVHYGWSKKMLSGTLFMDVKGAFDHVDPARLVKRMGEIGLDGDLIHWVASFLMDRQVQLVIDGHQGPKQPIDSGLPQGSPVSPILFIIYVRGVFQAIETRVPGVKTLSFADDIGLLTRANSVDEACQQLQLAGEVAIEWGAANGVQFDPEKTEAALFTRQRGRILRDQVQRARLAIGGKEVAFNQTATRWLGVLLDAGLTLKAHYQGRLQKAKKAEARVRALCRQRGLLPGLIWRIQKAAVQAVALYGAELWWRGQKDRTGGIQRLINQQARAITGAFWTTPIGPLIREAALEPAESLLEARQLGYAARILGLPTNQPTRQILPVTFRDGDQHAQPGEQPTGDRAWAEETPRGPWSLGQHLARQLGKSLRIDPSGGFEETTEISQGLFPGVIRVLPMEEALIAAREQRPGLSLWSDGSRFDNGRVGAGVAWQALGVWQARGIPLGLGKEVFDAELIGACEALELALKDRDKGPVTVLLDSQAAISRLQHQRAGPGQGLAIRAHRAAHALGAQGRPATIQWVPGHHGIEGNERADQAAKQAASKTPRGGQGKLSLAYTHRTRTEVARAQRQQWLTKALGRRSLPAQRAYRALPGWKLDPALASAPKKIASRYYQLKTGHAAIGAYLQKVQAQDSGACHSCQAPNETVYHLLFECREWRRQREALYRALGQAKVALPTAAEDHPEGRILGDPRATKAVLQFLTDTTIGTQRGVDQALNRANADDEWGLDALDEEDRGGEG
jgi:ribonuclease HI